MISFKWRIALFIIIGLGSGCLIYDNYQNIFRAVGGGALIGLAGMFAPEIIIFLLAIL